MWFLALYVFVSLFWTACKTLVRHPPPSFITGQQRLIFWRFPSLVIPAESLICINSLAPGRCCCNSKSYFFKLTKQYSSLGNSSEIALSWILQILTNKKSTLVQVMAWCCQAPSHCLSQWWSRSQSPCAVTRPQWVNLYKSWCLHNLSTEMGILLPQIIWYYFLVPWPKYTCNFLVIHVSSNSIPSVLSPWEDIWGGMSWNLSNFLGAKNVKS